MRSKYVRIGVPGDRRTVAVHRLILGAFVGPCPEGHEANHKNGDKHDNRVENLEWVTQSENATHAWQTGLMTAECVARGERQGASKLTASEVRDIRRRCAAGEQQKALAEEYGLNRSSVSKIIRGVNWKHIRHGETDDGTA
jgi:hypothetical protein